MPEVNVQRDTNVIIAFNEQEASELLTALLAFNWQRCPWADELRDRLIAERLFETADLKDLLDSDIVRVVSAQ